MEFSTSPYVTAASSPSCYHSAPASPGITDGGDFEFETSKKFDQSWDGKRREMAFADELFTNGHVMPLKLPPRLQFKLYTNQRSITCSTISPSAMVKSPFARRDVDPFVVAIQKVMKEENRGRDSTSNHHHRRTRSHSPFRAQNLEWTIEDMRKEIVSMSPIQPSSPNTRKLIESKAKGASYGRWVLNHSMTIGTTSKESNNLLFGTKEPNEGDAFVQTKMQRFKGMLVRYATFGRENNEGKMINPISALWNPNYLKKLSFKFKGNKKVNGGESKLVIVKFKPALCLGYGLESPRKM